MKTRSHFWSIPFCVSASLLAASCGQSIPHSELDTVDVPQTSVKDQQKVGFCWSYTTMGLVESFYKIRTGKTLDLSEEALGFYRVADGIMDEWDSYKNGFRKLEEIARDVQGYQVRSGKEFHSTDALDLVATYGLWPETAFSFKFDSTETETKVFAVVQKKAQEFAKLKGKSGKYSMADAISIAKQAFGIQPPSSFAIEGKMLTPKAFAMEYIKFNPNVFELIETKSAKDVYKIIAATKRALVRGLSVPMGFVPSVKYAKEGTFSYPAKTDAQFEKLTMVDISKDMEVFPYGGHAVLITDFVNDGGQLAALPTAQVIKEFTKPASALSYFRFKNSYGLNKNNPQVGNDGYNKIDYGYLKANAHMTSLRIVVPKDIAANPTGTESIHPSVTSDGIGGNGVTQGEIGSILPIPASPGNIPAVGTTIADRSFGPFADNEEKLLWNMLGILNGKKIGTKVYFEIDYDVEKFDALKIKSADGQSYEVSGIGNKEFYLTLPATIAIVTDSSGTSNKVQVKNIKYVFAD